MAEQKLLSNENVEEVIDLLIWWRNITQQQPGYTPPKRTPIDKATAFVAKVATGGIPGRAGLVPGSATCDIFELEQGTGGISLNDMDMERVVLNLSTDLVDAEYVVVHPVKGGNADAFVVTGSLLDAQTGTSTICVSSLGGVDLNELPTSTMDTGTGTPGPEPEYALGLDTNGCLVRIPISEC